MKNCKTSQNNFRTQVHTSIKLVNFSTTLLTLVRDPAPAYATLVLKKRVKLWFYGRILAKIRLFGSQNTINTSEKVHTTFMENK